MTPVFIYEFSICRSIAIQIRYRHIPAAKKACGQFIAHVGFPLFLGGLLYVLFRARSLVLFQWIEYAGFTAPIALVRDTVAPLLRIIPTWIIFSLPDGLWVYSFTSFTIMCWHKERHTAGKLFPLIGPTVGIGGEILQAFGCLPGIFDWVDLAIVFLGGMLPFLLYNNPFFLKNTNHPLIRSKA